MIFIIILCIILITNAEITINVLSQVNAVERYYDLFNRIRTYEITDIAGHPLMVAADDFVIKQPSSDHVGSCFSLDFTLNTIRTKQDQDPQSITFFLMYHNKTSNKPGDVFFQRTLLSPNGTGIWDTSLNRPSFTSFIINQGDLDDDNKTRFDFHNRSFLPYNETLWFGFFGTGPRHFSHTSLKENFMFWVTLNNNTGSTPIVNPLHENPVCINHHYHYRVIDVNNQLHLNFSDWTDARLVQPIIGVSTTTMNMAWQVQMKCLELTPSVIIPSSLSPSSQPTNIPSSTVSSPSSSIPTEEPSSPSSSVPTNYTNNNTNTTTVPIGQTNNTNNTDKGQTTESPSTSSHTTQIIIPLMGLLLFLVVIICVFFFIYKARERAKKKTIDVNLQQIVNDNENVLPTAHLTTSEDEDNNNNNNNMVWVDDNIYTDVSLESSSSKSKQVDQISQFINQNISSTKRVVRKKSVVNT